jgi:hypothetical protein
MSWLVVFDKPEAHFKEKEETTMKTTKGILIFLLLAVMILAITRSDAQGRGKEIGTTNPIDLVVNKKASGQSYTGTLAIYYYPGSVLGKVNMLVTMRLRHSSTWYPFAGIISNVDLTDTGTQAVRMRDEFLNGHVVPKLIYWEAVGANAVGEFRDYSNIVTDSVDFPGCCGYNSADTIHFVIMDIEVAIGN